MRGHLQGVAAGRSDKGRPHRPAARYPWMHLIGEASSMAVYKALVHVVAALRTMRIASNGQRTAHRAQPVQVAASSSCARLGPHTAEP